MTRISRQQSTARLDVCASGDRERLWNANIHYHPLLLRTIPARARCVLDVGCGDGILSAQLAEAGVPHVVGLDADAGVLDRAAARHPGNALEWRHGDVFTTAFEPRSFDAVVSVAMLHHVDAGKALLRFADLVRPGGVVAAVGLASNDWWDWPYAAVAYATRAGIGLVRGQWEHSAPMAWRPPETYRDIKRIAGCVLPGVRYRRHLLARYSLAWTKPD